MSIGPPAQLDCFSGTAKSVHPLCYSANDVLCVKPQPSRCTLCKVTTTKCTEVRSLSHNPSLTHIVPTFPFNRHCGEDPGPPHTPLGTSPAADQHAPAKAATSSIATAPKPGTPQETFNHPQNNNES